MNYGTMRRRVPCFRWGLPDKQMDEVTRTIPHRPPFLFVDELIDCNEAGATAKKHWDPGEAFYEGHYPGNPITPGVLLSEAVFQTGALFLGKLLEKEGRSLDEVTPVLSRIQDARFKAMVTPGETTRIDVQLKERVQNFYFLSGKVTNERGKTVLSLRFALGLVEST